VSGPQERRLAAYIGGLAQASGHADRHSALKNYLKGLLLPGEPKSVEPMAARLAPDNVRRMHQSLHHLGAVAPGTPGNAEASEAAGFFSHVDEGSVGRVDLWTTPVFQSKAGTRWELHGSIAVKSANTITARRQ
jgi:hypothetical protein